MRFNPFANGGISLNGLTDDELKMLAVQTGVSYNMLKTQQRAEMASAGSTGGVEGESLIPTVELKLVTNTKNPRKARKKNIKKMRKALRPPNYNLGLFKIYRYNAAHECACCGVDVRRFLEGDNAYNHIVDEKTGLSLADIYWFDEDTGQARKPLARTHGDHGDEMNSTLCPAHLHIYHTLRCMVDEHELAEEGFGKVVAKGTRFLKVPGLSRSQSKNRSTPESLAKYAQFFQMIQKDAQYSKGVVLNQHTNPITGVADLVTVTFDMRAMQMEQMAQQQSMMGVSPQDMQGTLIPQEPMQAQQ